MSIDTFDVTLADSQGTSVLPLEPKDFDIPAYEDYEAATLERYRQFNQRGAGVAVYRRFRVPEVYSWAAKDPMLSLRLQLAALKESTAYEADIPNFLEPWYGIGVASSAYGIDYHWLSGQAPAVYPKFQNADDAYDSLISSIEESPIGKRVLSIIEMFLEETDGRIPISPTDTQSPLNIISSYLMETTHFMLQLFDNPEGLKRLFSQVAKLVQRFLVTQLDLLGSARALPGHGFASSRLGSGIGFSDDNILMVGDEIYREFALPALLQSSSGIEPPVFHSCGQWSSRAGLITSIPGLYMADGAVGARTDPAPNSPEQLGQAFASQDSILHVRIVGDAEQVVEQVRRLYSPGLKLIVATYCKTPEEQKKAYDEIHAICD